MRISLHIGISGKQDIPGHTGQACPPHCGQPYTGRAFKWHWTAIRKTAQLHRCEYYV